MSPTSVLAKKVADYSDPRSVGSRFRAKRLAPLLAMIETVYRERGQVRVVDVGGTRQYWNIVPREYLERFDVRVTIVNLPGPLVERDDGRFSFLAGDGCDLSCIADNGFDIAHSNSVIEHVGDWERMVRFAREMARIAPRYFVQTPNYWFPLEPHCMTPFFHWLPRPLRVWLVLHFDLGHWRKAESVDAAVRICESARLLSRRMVRSLFADGHVMTERLLLLPKSFVVVRT